MLQELPHSVISIPSPDPPKRPFLPAHPLNLSSTYTEFHDFYHPLDEIYSFFDQLVAQFPDVTRMVELGRTAEGRKIFGLSVSTGPYQNIPSGAKMTDSPRRKGDEEDTLKKRKKNKKSHRPPLRDTEKLSFVIMGAQHAREVRILITLSFHPNLEYPFATVDSNFNRNLPSSFACGQQN